jgi:hypothetical protein
LGLPNQTKGCSGDLRLLSPRGPQLLSVSFSVLVMSPCLMRSSISGEEDYDCARRLYVGQASHHWPRAPASPSSHDSHPSFYASRYTHYNLISSGPPRLPLIYFYPHRWYLRPLRLLITEYVLFLITPIHGLPPHYPTSTSTPSLDLLFFGHHLQRSVTTNLLTASSLQRAPVSLANLSRF